VARVRNDEQYELRRTRILTEAAKVFRQKGYNSATMEDLATALGVTKAAVYYYYPKKHDILLEICEQALDRALERVRQNDAGQPAAERLRQLIADHVEIMTDNLEEWTVFFQELDLRKDPRARRVIARQREFGAQVEEMIQAGIDSGEFRADADVTLVSMAILGMCNWLYRWFRASGRSPDEIIQEFETLITNGLLSQPSQSMGANGRTPKGK
jgi:TetR/AcrR family transcriptional regulator, cholesterol catabolism regulator